MGKIIQRMCAGLITVVMAAGFCLPAGAEVTLDDVLKRIEALEQQNAALKAEVMALKQQTPVSVPAVAQAPAPMGNFLKTRFETELYGFVGVTASFSDSDAASATANSAIWAFTASRETADKNLNATNISAQDTRLGLNFKGPALEDDGLVTGKFEMDFSANNGPTYQPRLRLAYIQIDYPKWALTAGQTWDFFAPINPSMLNSGILWRGGNFGYRHPQLTLTRKWGEVLGGKMTTKVGVMDSEDPYQENNGYPVAAAYAGYETTVLGKPTTFGLGGILGNNSTDTLTAPGSNTNSIYGISAGMTTKLCDKLSFKAEGFSGAKLDDFYAGPSVGITNTGDLAASKSLQVSGGFVELAYNMTKKMETVFGFGIDDVDSNAVIAAGDRDDVWDVNRVYYTNLKYNVTKDLMLGVEYNFFDTRWFDGVKGESNRVLTSVVYKF